MGTKQKPATKTEIVTSLAESTGVAKKDVLTVLDGLVEVAKQAIGKRGPGVFNLHGIVKLKAVDKPATEARRGINPFTRQEQDFAAKPAKRVIKAVPLKCLKDAVS